MFGRIEELGAKLISENKYPYHYYDVSLFALDYATRFPEKKVRRFKVDYVAKLKKSDYIETTVINVTDTIQRSVFDEDFYANKILDFVKEPEWSVSNEHICLLGYGGASFENGRVDNYVSCRNYSHFDTDGTLQMSFIATTDYDSPQNPLLNAPLEIEISGITFRRCTSGSTIVKPRKSKVAKTNDDYDIPLKDFYGNDILMGDTISYPFGGDHNFYGCRVAIVESRTEKFIVHVGGGKSLAEKCVVIKAVDGRELKWN